MRIVGAVLVALLMALPAAAQTDNAAPLPAAKSTAQTSKFRNPATKTATLRAKTLRERADAKRTIGTAQPSDSAPPAAADNTVRLAAAAARKRAPTPPGPARDTSLAAADRIAIQFDLAWTGDYNGLINGEVNDKTTAAIKAFQRNRKFKETGVLNTQERALLAASAKAKQAQVGWTMVDDPVTGARLGVPDQAGPEQEPGQDRHPLVLGARTGPGRDLPDPGARHDAAACTSSRGRSRRRASSRSTSLRPDFFILSGMQGLKKFYVRAEIKDGEVRGMTVLYDQATEPHHGSGRGRDVERVHAVPRRRRRRADRPGAQAQGRIRHRHRRQRRRPHPHRPPGRPTAATSSSSPATATPTGWRRTRPPISRSCASTARPISCPRSLPATRRRVPTSRWSASPTRKARAAAARSRRSPRSSRATRLEPAPQLGFSGAAALDGQGRVVGMVELKTHVRRRQCRRNERAAAGDRGAGADASAPSSKRRRSRPQPAAPASTPPRHRWCG